MAETRRYITDVEEACALREAGLLWRNARDLGVYVPTDNWALDTIRWCWSTRAPDGFFILLED